MKSEKFIPLFLIIALSIIIIQVVLFIIWFYDNPFSDNPNDWYNAISVTVGIENVFITGFIAWLVHSMNKRNSRRNSILQFLGEIYIDLDYILNKYLIKVSRAIDEYDFSNIDVVHLMDELENELARIKPKCFAFYMEETNNNYILLYNSVRDYNYLLRKLKLDNPTTTYEEIFRNKDIIDLFISIKQYSNRTKNLMSKYMKE